METTLWVGLGMSALFIGIAFILNEGNAGRYLNGYKELSDEDKAKYPLAESLSLFKNFHLFLGVATAVGLIAFYLLKMEMGMAIFLGLFPIVAYLFFFYRSYKLLNHISSIKTPMIAGGVMLLITGIGVGYLSIAGAQPNELLVTDSGIEITGMYGVDFTEEEIASIKIIQELPKIKRKADGMAVGDVRKGRFSAEEIGRVHLVINGRSSEYLEIIDQKGKRYYFGDPEVDLKEVLGGL